MEPTSAPRSYAYFNLNPVYEIPIVWLLHEVPERRPVEKSDRAEGVADDVLSFDDVPLDLSFEDLERTFPRFSSLEGLGEYRV
ncbi:uncharacterized protein DS421_18g620780 [Arachis hypogaea]|nr:uncharacterized protein DS421_18g620780 [Arachis hypogaea]